jgi:hypothetical protein
MSRSGAKPAPQCDTRGRADVWRGAFFDHPDAARLMPNEVSFAIGASVLMHVAWERRKARVDT